MIEQLLTLADRTEYYKDGANPWPKDWQEQSPDGTPRSKAENKAHDNLKRLLRENDILISNQFKLKRALRNVVYFCALAVLAAWSPLWLPLLMKLAGLK